MFSKNAKNEKLKKKCEKYEKTINQTTEESII